MPRMRPLCAYCSCPLDVNRFKTKRVCPSVPAPSLHALCVWTASDGRTLSSRCAQHVPTMRSICRRRSGGEAIISLQEPYASTICPVCAHYVAKPLLDEIDCSTVRPVCAHCAPTRCPLYVNCCRTKPVRPKVCPRCAHDLPTMCPCPKIDGPTVRPVCALYTLTIVGVAESSDGPAPQ